MEKFFIEGELLGINKEKNFEVILFIKVFFVLECIINEINSLK